MPPTRIGCFFAAMLLAVWRLLAWSGPEAKPAPLPAAPKPITNSIGMKLVPVPAGTFLMGSPKEEKGRFDDEDRHEVRITRPFYMGAYEVTQGEYEKVMGKNPSLLIPGFRGVVRVEGPTGSFPVECVTWDDARKFCEKLSDRAEEKRAGRVYRLPTEAEWEYACREAGKSTTPFHYGDSITSHQANFNGKHPYGTSVQGPYLHCTTKVGSYKPNALGLYDMHGNVVEWCQDWWDEAYYAKSPRIDPTSSPDGDARVLRGGDWANEGRHARSANRTAIRPTFKGPSVGFRVVVHIAPGDR